MFMLLISIICMYLLVQSLANSSDLTEYPVTTMNVTQWTTVSTEGMDDIFGDVNFTLIPSLEPNNLNALKMSKEINLSNETKAETKVETNTSFVNERTRNLTEAEKVKVTAVTIENTTQHLKKDNKIEGKPGNVDVTSHVIVTSIRITKIVNTSVSTISKQEDDILQVFRILIPLIVLCIMLLYISCLVWYYRGRILGMENADKKGQGSVCSRNSEDDTLRMRYKAMDAKDDSLATINNKETGVNNYFSLNRT